ncbi:hypothetical protein [Paenibacillus sp. LjRoot56]|uniref:hypothetical protein n=1 Tax=Paenibacillus sp. LjRoot56 TaxID=3342333 RepID=UPI003ECE725F
MNVRKDTVNYEDFGAVGDGLFDDMEAICAAHAYANQHRLTVRTKPDAIYYIGNRALTAVIETEVNWSTTCFTIDDTKVENHKLPCFLVQSAQRPYELEILSLVRDQKQLDISLEEDCYVMVTNSEVKRFIRHGLNQNAGTDQTDCFIVQEDGTIPTPIDWDYEQITAVEASPIDRTVLYLRGGIFTTLANRGESKYDYYARGIDITRSNTVVDGVTHYLSGEIGHGSPYRGFLSAMRCAYITIQNCFLSGHKIYTTIGAAGAPVKMGSYDLHANHVVDLTLINCTMNHIHDRTRWGVVATNFCKNIHVDGCTFTRLDAHMGVSGEYSIKNSTIGWQGVKAIGRGHLTLENVTSYANALIEFRQDYGSTWDGDVHIRNCTWIPSNGDIVLPELFLMRNRGNHDFGYVCYMPRHIEISNLFVDDSHVPEHYEGMYLFSDPWDSVSVNMENQLYSYVACQSFVARQLTTASGIRPTISSNSLPFRQTVWSMTEEEASSR